MHFFLDFDGVVHPDDVVLKNDEPFLKGEGELFMWVPLLEQTLKQFSDQNIQIVLSTSWAARLGLAYAKSRLPISIQSLIVDATWQKNSYRTTGLTQARYWRMTRYEQISHYAHRNKIFHWLALDNDAKGWPQDLRLRLVHTNKDLGMTTPGVLDDLPEKLARVLLEEQLSA